MGWNLEVSDCCAGSTVWFAARNNLQAARLTPLLEFLKADALVAMSPSGLSLNATVAYSARRLELGCLFYRRDRTECDGTCPATRAKRVAWGKAISERERRSKRKLFSPLESADYRDFFVCIVEPVPLALEGAVQ
jgi:hypothetical protein